MKHKDGRWVDVEVLSSPVFEADGHPVGFVGITRDVSARKQAENAVRHAERRASALIENAPDGIVFLTPDGKFTYASPSTRKLFGYESSELSNLSPDELTHPDDLPMVLVALDGVIQDPSQVATIQYRFRHKDGNWRWIESIFSNLVAESSIAAIVINFRDISERKRLEAERQALLEIMQGVTATEGLQEFLALVHHSLARVIYAENFSVVLHNQNTGLFEEVYAVDKYDSPMPPSRLTKSITSYVFRSGEPLLLDQAKFDELEARGEVELIGTDSPSWLGAPLMIPGETIGVIVVQNYEDSDCYSERDREFLASVCTQVSLAIERKQAEEALRESEENYRRLFENASLGIFQSTPEGKAISVNVAFARMFGYDSPTDALKCIRNVSADVFADPNRRAEIIGLMAENPDLRIFENLYRRKDGSTFIGSLNSMPIRDANGTLIRIEGIIEDITRRKQAEEAIRTYSERLEKEVAARTRELQDAQEKLVRQEKLAVLGQLAGGVGHELRNPLSVITNATYLLRLVQAEASPQVKEYLGIIEQETHTAEQIINDLLEFSLTKSVSREPVPVKEMLQQVVERFRVPDNVTVIFKLPADLPPVFADLRHMQQVFVNLTVNACQAMPQGGTLTLSAKKKGKEIAIAVADTGTGIAPENMAKIFEPLFTTKAKGIGLGLAVSRKLVEANSGRLEVQSEPGTGSIFTVYLQQQEE